MNCREAQRILLEIGKREPNDSLPTELQKHLEKCAACSKQANAYGMLQAGIDAGRMEVPLGTVPFEFMKNRIISEIKDTDNTGLQRIWLHPVLSATAALLVLAAAFTPWNSRKIVGYEVAVSGVERRLIEESDLMCDLLMELGLPDADIDLLGCDTTCKLHVVRLKNESEARLVMNAVTTIQEPEVRVSIRPVRDGSEQHRRIGESSLM